MKQSPNQVGECFKFCGRVFQIFVAFSEYPNFKKINSACQKIHQKRSSAKKLNKKLTSLVSKVVPRGRACRFGDHGFCQKAGYPLTSLGVCA